MPHDVLEMDGYESLESIGSGSFGLIRKVRRKADGVILARKEIDYRKMTTKEKEQLVAEVNILKDLKHPNIVQFLERVIDREHCFIYILMEYCEGGDLATVIKRHKEKQTRVPEEFVWNIMVQLIMALHECHHGTTTNEETHQITPRPILHRDLKPDNGMAEANVTRRDIPAQEICEMRIELTLNNHQSERVFTIVFLDGKHNVKLGDFGLSRSLTNPQKAFAQTYVGTPFYMSPELISEFTYDAKSDIWSLGCVIYELCALEPPFLADTQAQLSARIKEGRVKSLPSQYTQELDNVVKWMLQVNSRKRPTTRDLLNDTRIKNVQTELELRCQTADLQVRLQAQVMREARVSEHEAILTQVDSDQRSREQKLREQETTLNSREESLRNADEVLRNKEINLGNWEQRLIKEQQLLEERIREVLEQEKMIASRKSLPGGSSSTEAMMVDSKSTYDLPSSATISTNSTAMDSNHMNGIANKHTRSTGHSSKPTLFSANHKTTLPIPNSYSTSMFSASANAAPKSAADSATSPGDASSTVRAAPRRKTGLNVGRHSLQTATASRTRTSGGHVSMSAASHASATDAQDKGGLFSGQVSSNPIITQPRPSSVFASLSTIDSTSNPSKLYQGQSYTYHGNTSKESRLSGRPSLDAPRLRNKSKSASTLVAPMSSTTLSGTGGASSSTAATTASTGNTTSSNNVNSPFLVTDSGKPTATLPTTSDATTSSSAADQSNITFGNNSNATFYFTPSATLTSIRPPDKSMDTPDVQMGETPAVPTSSSSSSTRLSSGAPSTSNGHVRNSSSQQHDNGVTPASSSSVSAGSSSSVVTSVPQGFPSSRSNTSGITASMGHIRFQPQPLSQTTTGSGGVSAVTNGVASTAATGAITQAAASTSAVGSASTGAHDSHSTTTPIKFHIGSGGGSTSGGGSRGNGGTVPHILGADRFTRDSTPPPSSRSHHKHSHHSHHQHHHHQYQQQHQHQQQAHHHQQQQQQLPQETYYRDADDDLRMEWDGDIPSPFIKKTYNRPLGGGDILHDKEGWFRAEHRGIVLGMYFFEFVIQKSVLGAAAAAALLITLRILLSSTLTVDGSSFELGLCAI
ncbi:G2-specific serine/threonine protein kinase [Mortierella sp. AD032]|nr:G2-specific serine/threonine protein kinase [Mortierella sp. AD032]